MSDKQKENLHLNHRLNLRNRYLSEGIGHFEDHQILELILFYAIPRIDTNPIAHRLINRYGSLTKVLEARPEDLCKIEGIGESSAVLIKLFFDISKKYISSVSAAPNKVLSYDELGNLFLSRYAGITHEMVYAVYFDSAMRIICEEMLHKGDINAVGFSSRKLAERAISNNAVFIAVAHNHPHGLPLASSNDLNTTATLRNFLAQMNITMIDHFIIAAGKYSSLFKEEYDNTVDTYRSLNKTKPPISE